jgi:hypothetical protein
MMTLLMIMMTWHDNDTTDDNDNIADGNDDTTCLETLRSEEGNVQLGGNQWTVPQIEYKNSTQ